MAGNNTGLNMQMPASGQRYGMEPVFTVSALFSFIFTVLIFSVF